MHLSYSVIDLNLDGGLGGITDTLKNKYAIEDTLMWGGLTAVKHANGRDWWVIAHQFYSDLYYKLLLTPSGILGPYEQHIGSDSINDIFVQGTFSPDGSKYCLSSYSGWFDYMHFDRCTGEFSNPVSVYNPSASDHYFYGSSFSPNGRFIYASSTHNLYQYNTWDSDMEANAIHIAAWDSFRDPVFDLPIFFFMHQYAPDGKIYLGTFNGSKYLNVINSPDSFGLVCNFTPHSFVISHNCYGDVPPSFPNYDLGVLEGSPCDTIVNIPTGLESSSHPPSFRISPNPAKDMLNFVYQTSEDVLFELYDVNGHSVAIESLDQYFRNRIVDVSSLAEGIYFATIKQKGKEVWNEKIIIAR